MQDRDSIIPPLTAIARRMRVSTVLREWAWAACAISGVWVVYQILAAVIAAPALLSALTALLALLAIILVGFYAARSMRRITLAQAAATADGRANLNDELKSAYWFAQNAASSPLVDLQIRRAILTAQRISPSKLFAISIPRSAFAAAGLALIAGSLAWYSPRIVYTQTPPSVSMAMETIANATRAARTLPDAVRDQPQAALDDGTAGGANAAWAKLEATLSALGKGEELKAAATAIKSRDAAQAAQLLEAIDRRLAFAQAQPGVGREPAAGASSELLARLKDLFSSGDPSQPTAEASADDQLQRALELAQRLEDDRQTRAAAQHSVDDATNNPLQAAVPLERYGPREARRAETRGGDFVGTTDVEGGAMGRRVTETTVGAGGKPSTSENSDNNNIEADPILGKRTMRLAAQLERVKLESNAADNGGAQSLSDGVYAATRAQQAQLGYQNAAQPARYVNESAVSGERVPLAYRGAVKNYFLNLNRNEP